ncbi:MAG: Gfo/Idh/MocA family oxidoreductase [Candidatus Omnitrophica bacterium]|nr:Gfo/Idh/MocA family oxidoreductase [Candidatus Omnitrophota bacterium]
MRIVVIGLGVQGRKRMAVAKDEVVATVDPVVEEATFHAIEEVPLDSFDAALVCTPDHTKAGLLRYLLSHRKHVLVEKPLVSADVETLREFETLARESYVACYTAYNHRFEPHIVRMKALLDAGTLGPLYLVRGFYGNGTARDVRSSLWRDQGRGVLSDLGSHLLDIGLFLFGEIDGKFELWSANRFENEAFDHVLFGVTGRPVMEWEGTFVAWRNTFTLDVFGERGSAHIHGLCKWGPSRFILRHRVLPSGRPSEHVDTLEQADPTWALEYAYFKQLCRSGGTNLENDIWIAAVLHGLDRAIGHEVPA